MIQIHDKKNCCGCAACVQRCPKHCITLHEDAEGFLYPEVDPSVCIDCGLCEKVCPVLHPGLPCRPEQAYAAYHSDESVRSCSSSGGVFTALSTVVLQEGGVVFGARFDEQFEVVHDYTETLEGLSVFRGSKYLQSRIGDTFRQAESFLKEGRKVLFSGTPCQISGLLRFLRKEYANLLTVDFICHGVPSSLAWRSYLRNACASVSPSSTYRLPQTVSFRDKTHGWKNYEVHVEFPSASGSGVVHEKFFSNAYMRGFLHDLYLRPSCYSCPSKCQKSGADLTIGDFWGIERVLPDFDDDRGMNSVLVHTEKGSQIWKRLSLPCRAVRYEDVLRGNPALEHSPAYPGKKRALFYTHLLTTPFNTLITRLLTPSLSELFRRKLRSLLRKIKNLLLAK